jgi:hypothetical protein
MTLQRRLILLFGLPGELQEAVSAENGSIGLATQLGHWRVAIVSVE